MKLTYPIILKRSQEGVAVGCPVLPGCWSQGDTEEEAIEQIQIAIREYLEVLEASRQSLKGKMDPEMPI